MAIKLLGHPVHQMLIVVPLGLMTGAVLFDIIALATSTTGLWQASWYMIGAGAVAGLVAAPFGLIDWLGIPPGTRAKAVGALHGAGNVLVVLLFGISWYLRSPDPFAPSWAALGISFAGFLFSLVTGWLGGELVDRLGVGVDDGANVNAPSSLTSRAARTGF
jgi:uncharacterized membrane protein